MRRPRSRPRRRMPPAAFGLGAGSRKPVSSACGRSNPFVRPAGFANPNHPRRATTAGSPKTVRSFPSRPRFLRSLHPLGTPPTSYEGPKGRGFPRDLVSVVTTLRLETTGRIVRIIPIPPRAIAAPADAASSRGRKRRQTRRKPARGRNPQKDRAVGPIPKGRSHRDSSRRAHGRAA